VACSESGERGDGGPSGQTDQTREFAVMGKALEEPGLSCSCGLLPGWIGAPGPQGPTAPMCSNLEMLHGAPRSGSRDRECTRFLAVACLPRSFRRCLFFSTLLDASGQWRPGCVSASVSAGRWFCRCRWPHQSPAVFAPTILTPDGAMVRWPGTKQQRRRWHRGGELPIPTGTGPW
jgi:hypothetical protein